MNFFIGILALILASILFSYEIKRYSKLEENDYIRKSFSIKRIGAVFVFLIIGIVMIYRELKHIL